MFSSGVPSRRRPSDHRLGCRSHDFIATTDASHQQAWKHDPHYLQGGKENSISVSYSSWTVFITFSATLFERAAKCGKNKRHANFYNSWKSSKWIKNQVKINNCEHILKVLPDAMCCIPASEQWRSLQRWPTECFSSRNSPWHHGNPKNKANYKANEH